MSRARRYMRDYLEGVTAHYEFRGEHFAQTSGYDSCAAASEQLRQAAEDDVLAGFIAGNLAGSPERIADLHEARRALIGDYAEKLAYLNCFMDRDSLDAQVTQAEGPYTIIHRVTGEPLTLTKGEYEDLIRLHLCDWLEQAPRAHQWNYRRTAYRQMAERLGGVALAAYDQVFALEPTTA